MFYKTPLMSKKIAIILSLFIITVLINTLVYSAENDGKIIYPKPSNLLKVSGDFQSGYVKTPLPEPFIVEVQNEFKSPIPGAEVKFTVIAGGGNFQGNSTINVITDSKGRARANLTIGDKKETNVVRVSVGNVKPVDFSATVLNTPPTLVKIGSKKVAEGETLQFTVFATDPNPEDRIKISAEGLPANANFDVYTNVFTFKPDYNQAGLYNVTFFAHDGYSGVSEVVPITVVNVNRPPVLSQIGPKTIDENKELIINLSATDPDGDRVSFLALDAPPGSVLQSQSGTYNAVFKWTPGFDTVTSGNSKDFFVTFVVNDNFGGSDSERVTITVRNVNPTTFPDIDVLPPELDFGNVAVGNSADRIFEIYNKGNAILKILSMKSDNPDFSFVAFAESDDQFNFIASSSDQFISIKSSSNDKSLIIGFPDIKPGAKLIIKTRFMPSSGGEKQGKFLIESNDPDEGIFIVNMKGNASQTPNIRVSTSNIDFGDITVGTSAYKNLKIYNDGNSLLKIYDIISNDPQFSATGFSNVNPFSDITVLIQFKPSSVGAKLAKLSIVSNDPDEPIVTVTSQGKGITPATPKIRLSHTNIDFGNVEVGTTSDRNFNIYNDGTAVLQINSIVSNSNQFVVSANPGNINPGGMATVLVRFAPSSAGLKNGIITIKSNDPNEPNKTLNLQGNGVITQIPDIRVSTANLDFGEVEVGATSEKAFRIFNDGNARLKIWSINSNNNQFTTSGFSDIDPGNSIEIKVWFTPNSTGQITGSITINNNDPDESNTVVSVQGKGIRIQRPDIRVLPTSQDYGNVYVGSFLDKKFRIYNDGNATLVIFSIISDNSQFAVMGYSNIEPGKWLDVTIRFAPASAGLKNGVITINSNDPDEAEVKIPVRGTGVNIPKPDIRVSTTNIEFGEVEIGKFLDKEFIIYNDGDAILQIYSITSSNGRFTILNDPDVPSKDFVKIIVRFTPTMVGIETGTIVIKSNDPDKPNVSITVNGKGVKPKYPDIYVSHLSLDFGNLEYGKSSEAFFTIYNLGDALLKITSIISSDSQFEILNKADVLPDQNIKIYIRFRPESLGEKSAYITIYSNDPDEATVKVQLYGNCIYPDIPTSGWQLISQQNLLVDMYDIHFVSDSTGWIVGNSGTVAFTNDGGATWTPQSKVTNQNLKSVYFNDFNTGWAGGRYGTLLRTTNGGYTWQTHYSGVLRDLNDIEFIGYYTGWIVGESGLILATNDGYTWTSRISGTSYDLYDVHFINASRGWAVGGNGTIIYTTDGGNTWTPQYSGTSATLYGVDFLNANEGWAVGSSGVIIRTTNGGLTWTHQNSGVPYYISIMDVDFVTSTHGWAVGQNGLVLSTEDGGIKWKTMPSNTTEILRSVQFRSLTKGWIVGSNGTILKYYTTDYTPPVINSVTIQGSPAKAGGTITVIAVGQPKNNAKFSISGIVSDVPMVEYIPGSYKGTFTVPAGVNATNALVTVTLTNLQGYSTTDTSKTVTIDSISVINTANVIPRTAKAGDTIVVTMNGEIQGTASFSIEGLPGDRSMVESQSSPGNYTGTYIVPQNVAAKDARVIVKLIDKAGNIAEKEAGKITIDSTAEIISASVNGSPAKLGDTITVILVGEQGGTAKFSITGVVSDVAMSESPAGVYTGTYKPIKGVNVKDSQVTVELKDTFGNTGTKTAGFVTIDTESRIDSVIITGSPAKLNGKITVTLNGEANGTATFNIANVIDNMPMIQTAGQPGNYVGSYIATGNINVTDAILTVTLKDAMGNVNSDSSQKVTIDTIGPIINSVDISGSPAKLGGVISVVVIGENNCTATFSIAGVVDNVPMAQVSGQPGKYTGAYSVTGNINAVNAILTVSLKDPVGNVTTNSNQRVTIDTVSPSITAINISGSPAKAGDNIVVTMTGEANGTAAFGIAGVVDNVPMPQSPSQPGNYIGTYMVPHGVSVVDAVLTVTLKDEVGNITVNATKKVTIDTVPPSITSVIVSGSPAKKGGTIAITMIGEKDCSASFSIAGVAENMPMTQSATSLGTYNGKYTVTDDINITNSIVTVALKDSLGNISTDTSQRVTIDTISPLITSVSVSGFIVKGGDTLSITIVGQANANAWFAISGVTDKIPMLEDKNKPGTYTGKYSVASNINISNALLTISLADEAGNISTDTKNYVTIDNIAPEINSVTVSGSPAKNGEYINVLMTGEPKGLARFSIAGLTGDFAMLEDTKNPGRYSGSYKVDRNEIILNAVLTVTLKDMAGNLKTDSSKKVSIVNSSDINRDGVIDINDIVLVGKNFGNISEKNEADLNNDGIVDILDLIIVCKSLISIPNAAPSNINSLKANPEQIEILKILYDSIKTANNKEADFAREILAQLIGIDKVAKSELMQNYPNPFNPDTWIPFKLEKPGNVIIRIYNSNGQLIRTIDLGYKNSGVYQNKDKAAYWDGTNESGEKVSSGVYFYRIQTDDFSAVRKMILVK